VGYGDITPATDLAKRLAVIEMFVGQVFLITLVARLVSLWGKPLERAETN
jgi:voltage-gated potassium channel Kch